MRTFRLPVLAAACVVVLAFQPAEAMSRDAATAMARRGGVALQTPLRIAGTDTALTCFDGPLSLILNPACFFIENPPMGGDCISHAAHYFIQYVTPSFATPHRITGFGFISNDQATVFPSAGIVLIPHTQNRFPTPAELAALQVDNIPTPHDTAVVVVDLRQVTPPLVVTSGTDVVVCLQFPEGGELTGPNPGMGPGIAVDDDASDPRCDHLTLDGGQTYADNATNDPLDWGFEIVFEPTTAVESRSWSDLKLLYGGAPAVRLYRDP